MEASPRRSGVHAVHSLDRFVVSVPDLQAAEHFYRSFGLSVQRVGEGVDLRTAGSSHCWGRVFPATDGAFRLQYLRFGIDAQDVPALRERIVRGNFGCAPHPFDDGDGLWLRNPDGLPLQLVVAPKVSPARARMPTPRPRVAAGTGASPARSQVPPVHPRALSHILCFTPDVERMVRFCIGVLGLRLSDRSGNDIAFLHGAHGSDHHLLAFARSSHPGLHHTSWEVGSIDEVGAGAEQMRSAGYEHGWGLGRHVLGSNYFHYVRDPWGGWAEYSFDMDFVPHDLDWQSADHPPEDSFYAWGPPVPGDFTRNHQPT